MREGYTPPSVEIEKEYQREVQQKGGKIEQFNTAEERQQHLRAEIRSFKERLAVLDKEAAELSQMVLGKRGLARQADIRSESQHLREEIERRTAELQRAN